MEDDELDLPEPDSDERRLNIQMPAELISRHVRELRERQLLAVRVHADLRADRARGRGGRRAGHGRREGERLARFIPELIEALQDSWSKYVTREGIRNLPEAPGHPDADDPDS